MKRVCILLSIFTCLLCQSCQNDETEPIVDNPQAEIHAPSEGMLLDGGVISGINLYCLEYNKQYYGMQWYEYYPLTKTVTDYNSFRLFLLFNGNAPVYSSDNKEEMTSIFKNMLEYEKERSNFILESYNTYTKGAKGWPALFTAFINGELTITCDKVIFGEEAGTNLLPHFTVIAESQCIPIGVENPTFLYNYGDNIPTEATKVFVKDTWLQPKYVLHFAETPTEKYEDLTFHITLPMKKEHIRDMAVSKHKTGVEPDRKYSEEVFSSDCQIKFNWN